ncbi:MAG TPA: alpha-amylase family protein, partial [Acetobacteraceae bacterium]|nr:alpha-amylase family protein [Acetobacteraceae bacterium]
DLQAAGMGFYIENIATDFYAAYHRWFPGKPVNWRFVDAQQRYRADPTDRRLLFREPSLSDPVWLARIRARLMTTVRVYRADHPLYYNLADESGIADLTAFWDFDLSPESVAGMRHWLRQQYGSLAALNAEWGSQFQSWDAVQPETTRQAMQRHDGNYAAWSDFKAWMDLSYARALRAGTDAVHAADPQAVAGMEGVQVPGWGGFNYADLAHAVDLMEVSGFGNESLPLLQSLNPRLIPLVTTGGSDPGSLRSIWYATLNGVRGLVLWDGSDSIVRPDGTLGPDGKAFAPAFAALHRVAPVLSASTPVWDPVAILYSPESFRLQWMLDQQPKGDAWMRRKSETELESNAWRRALRGYLDSLRGLHLRPRFVTASMLPGLRARVLILPDTLSLSPQAARAITRFAAQGGLVIADRQPGEFDGHGKRLAQPDLPLGIVHLVPPSDRAALRRSLAPAGVMPAIKLDDPDGSSASDVWLYLYRHGDGFVLALERRDGGAAPRSVVLRLPPGTTVLRRVLGGKVERAGNRITVALPPVEPTILLLASTSHQPP